MATNKNKYPNLTRVLNDFGKFLVEEYKDNLLINDKIASGDLYESVEYIVNTKNKGTFSVQISLNDYAKYIEKGRKAGKFPPISAIEKWIKVKPVLPRPYNGKLPTTKQLAYLIARKIALDGIKPQPLLQQSLNDVMDVMMEFIEEAIYKDIENEFEMIFNEIGFN